MKYFRFCIIVMGLWRAGMCLTASAAEEVYFPDASFEAAVRDALGIPAPEPITDNDMLGLTYLYAPGCGITDITGVGYAVNITELNLPTNNLTVLPAEIGGLVHLTYLYLSANQLTELPPEMANLTVLQWLDVSSNPLQQFPAVIGSLANLQVLNLSATQLREAPAEVGNLTHLWYLNLSDNQLADVPPEVAGLTSLTSLWLQGNPLATPFYCRRLAEIRAAIPGLYIQVDPNPNTLTEDCSTELVELALFAAQWCDSYCDPADNWCGYSDLNHDGNVDLIDVAIFSGLWLN